ncbi:MAG: zinc ABC transporter substrate-binding protein [bacterium]|nr:zinc ABC transporter substrate-binding protein [bacterium]
MKYINFKRVFSAIVLGILVSASVMLSACKSDADLDTRPRVLSTVGMIDDIVKNVGGKYVNAKAIMGPGVDPHLFQASAGDLKSLSEANLILYVGLHLEAKMTDVFEKMASKTKVAAVSSRMPKDRLVSPPEFDGQYDPHVWFDVGLWMHAVEVVRDELSKLDPSHETEFNQNAQDYLSMLEDLDFYVNEMASRVPKSQRVLITAHDAFGYFGRAYGFKVLGLQGISTESEAGTKDVQHLTNYIVKHKIKAIFVESSVPARTIQAVQASVKSKGWNVEIGGELFADAMGKAGTKEGTYDGMVRHNVNTIVGALTGQPIGDEVE